MRHCLLPALCAVAVLTCGCKKDPDSQARDGLKTIAHGAAAYAQSEHPIDREPWVATGSYPLAHREVCEFMPVETGIWGDLQFSSDAETIEWCYQSDGRSFIATATTDLTTWCISGSAGAQLSEVTEGDCSLY